MNVGIIILVIIICLLFLCQYKKRYRKYSWDDFAENFGNMHGKYAVYDHSLHQSETTDFLYFIEDKYKSLFNKRDDDPFTYMIKMSHENATEGEKKLLDYVKPITDKEKTDLKVILRIQTNPWWHSSHFDTYDQKIVMVDGYKKWILFYPEFTNIEEEKDFIKQTNGMKLSKLESHLKKLGIPYQVKITGPGDSLFIKMGVYHATENENIGKGVIFLNFVLRVSDEFQKRFHQLWPTKSTRCQNNFLY